MHIITPTGNGDILSPFGHRYLGEVKNECIGSLDAWTEHGCEVHEAVFEETACNLLLGIMQEVSDSSIVVVEEEDVKEDDATLPEVEAEWGAGWVNDYPARGSSSRAKEGFDSRLNRDEG